MVFTLWGVSVEASPEMEIVGGKLEGTVQEMLLSLAGYGLCALMCIYNLVKTIKLIKPDLSLSAMPDIHPYFK